LGVTKGPGGCPFEVTTPRWQIEKTKVDVTTLVAKRCPLVLFVLGGPACGKTGQCLEIERHFRQMTRLEIGKLHQEELESAGGSPDATVIQECLAAGRTVPPDVSVRLLRKAMESVDWERGKFIIDGFPSDMAGLEAWNKAMKSDVKCHGCIHMDTSENVLLKRCVEGLSMNFEAAKAKIDAYMKDLNEVFQWFKYEGLYVRIDSNREFRKVWEEVQQIFIVELYNNEHHSDGAAGSVMKQIWLLRDKQTEEIFPTSRSHVSVEKTVGEDARSFTSYKILAKHREKHTRNMNGPLENYVEPMTMAQEIGWFPEYTEGVPMGTKGIPKGTDTQRTFHPRSTCAMTRHLENMYSTNAQHIMRRW